MTVYTYCSYKLSPVGFQIGKFKYDEDKREDIIPDTNPEKMNRFELFTLIIVWRLQRNM